MFNLDNSKNSKSQSIPSKVTTLFVKGDKQFCKYIKPAGSLRMDFKQNIAAVDDDDENKEQFLFEIY